MTTIRLPATMLRSDTPLLALAEMAKAQGMRVKFRREGLRLVPYTIPRSADVIPFPVREGGPA